MAPLRIATLLFAGLLAGACANQTQRPIEIVTLPGMYAPGNGDADIWAFNTAQWSFASAQRLAGRPIDAARAAAALEYIAVIVRTPRWAGMGPIIESELAGGRDELRQALGIAPGTPSQPVISSLLASAEALAAGNNAAALQALSGPQFTFGAERTLAILNAMPFLRAANIATMHAGVRDLANGGLIVF